MRSGLVVRPLEPLPRFVAGADAAYSADKTTVLAAAVVYDRQERRVVEIAHALRAGEDPYIPPFLRFREGAAGAQGIPALEHQVGGVCFDGPGGAHPRPGGVA